MGKAVCGMLAFSYIIFHHNLVWSSRVGLGHFPVGDVIVCVVRAYLIHYRRSSSKHSLTFHILDLSVVKGEKAKIQDTAHKAELASQARNY
jgi:hypothetical protein